MKYNIRILILFFLSLPFISAQTKIQSEESKPIKLFDGAFFTEGPAFGPDGNVYFSDITFTSETNMDAGIIWKYDSKSGITSVYRSPSGMANGIEFDKNGNMIVCEGADFGGRKITQTDLLSGKSKIVSGLFNNLPYNSPNDLVIDSKGMIYFTDPMYTGHELAEQPCFGVYRVNGNKEVTLLIDTIKMPNGITLSPDENRLYVGCNYEGNIEKNIPPQNAVYVYDLNGDGNVSNGRMFIKLSDDAYPDGMTTDKHGNLYVAIRDENKPGIYIYNNNAELIEIIHLPEVPSNLTFGKEKERNSLFITAGGSLYKIKTLSEGNK